jgi:hypothetical protein
MLVKTVQNQQRQDVNECPLVSKMLLSMLIQDNLLLPKINTIKPVLRGHFWDKENVAL